MIEEITQMLQVEGTGVSVLLVIGLIIALVLAFKVMEMVFETVIVTMLSGGFYLALKYLQGGLIDLNDLLLFSFLGASLYMLYSMLESLYKVGATVIPLPYKLTKTLFKPFQYIHEKHEERQKRKSYVNRDEKEEESKEDDSPSKKEVILGNKDEKSEEEED